MTDIERLERQAEESAARAAEAYSLAHQAGQARLQAQWKLEAASEREGEALAAEEECALAAVQAAEAFRTATIHRSRVQFGSQYQHLDPARARALKLYGQAHDRLAYARMRVKRYRERLEAAEPMPTESEQAEATHAALCHDAANACLRVQEAFEDAARASVYGETRESLVARQYLAEAESAANSLFEEVPPRPTE